MVCIFVYIVYIVCAGGGGPYDGVASHPGRCRNTQLLHNMKFGERDGLMDRWVETPLKNHGFCACRRVGQEVIYSMHQHKEDAC